MIKQLTALVNKEIATTKPKEPPKTEILKISKPKESTTLAKPSK